MQTNLPSNFYVNLKEFRIIYLLETNAFSKSYLIENIITKKFYFSVESTNKDLFIRSEIEELAKLNYPSFYTPVGYSETNFDNQEFPTVLFDFMQNETLASLFSNMGFELSRDTKSYIILLGTAIAMRKFNKPRKSFFLNLTPSNIFLNDNIYPLLLNFGKSLIPIDDFVKAVHLNGQKLPIYTAPEILAHQPYNHKADSYSFSLIAYQIITGLVPYEKLLDKSVQEFTEEVVNGYRPNISMITSQCIKSFFELCWSPIPSNRPSFPAIVEMLTEYSFYKVFDLDHKEVIRYMKFFDPECNIPISIFQKNQPELNQEEIEYLKNETHRSEEEIWHAFEEIQNNPIDFSEGSKSFDEIVTTMMSLSDNRRRTVEIYIYFTQKKQFDINQELDHLYSQSAFGATESTESRDDRFVFDDSIVV